MVSRSRRGRPRKPGRRYRNGHLKPLEPMNSPRAVANSQPHRRGLGDDVLDQRAESLVGRMALCGEITAMQLLAGEHYGGQWRCYLATLDGPRWPWRGGGRVSVCDGCPGTDQGDRCACGLAARAWRRSWDCLARMGVATMVTELVAYNIPVAMEELITLRLGLDALAYELGLTNDRGGLTNRLKNGQKAVYPILP